MAQPPQYLRDKNFTDDSGSGTDHSAINAELDRVSDSINDIRFNLALIQADDGRLRSDVVTYDSLDDQIVRDISGAARAEAAAVRAEQAAREAAEKAAKGIPGATGEQGLQGEPGPPGISPRIDVIDCGYAQETQVTIINAGDAFFHS